MTTQWEIRDEDAVEAEAIEKWGREEWQDRKRICEQKRDELEDKYNWETRCIVGTQFDAIARVMKQEMWDNFKEWPVTKWHAMVMRLVG